MNKRQEIYTLQMPVALTFFRDVTSFFRHCTDHFCSREEPWDRVFTRDFIKKLRKKCKLGALANVEWDEEWQDFYERICEACDAGIRESCQEPLYATAFQYIEGATGNSTQRCAYFITGKAFVVIAKNGKVCSAYYSSKAAERSNHFLYQAAWDHIRSKLSMSRYLDEKGGCTIHNTRVEFVSPSNWRKCPNPYPRPKRGKWREAFESEDLPSRRVPV